MNDFLILLIYPALTIRCGIFRIFGSAEGTFARQKERKSLFFVFVLANSYLCALLNEDHTGRRDAMGACGGPQRPGQLRCEGAGATPACALAKDLLPVHDIKAALGLAHTLASEVIDT